MTSLTVTNVHVPRDVVIQLILYRDNFQELYRDNFSYKYTNIATR